MIPINDTLLIHLQLQLSPVVVGYKLKDLGWMLTQRDTILPVVLTVTCPASHVCES